MGKRLAYALLGAGIGLSIRFAILLLKGTADWTSAIMSVGSLGMAIGFGGLAVSIAERRRKVLSRGEIDKPLPLFPSK